MRGLHAEILVVGRSCSGGGEGGRERPEVDDLSSVGVGDLDSGGFGEGGGDAVAGWDESGGHFGRVGKVWDFVYVYCVI